MMSKQSFDFPLWTYILLSIAFRPSLCFLSRWCLYGAAMDIGHVGSARQAALEGLRAAQTRLSNALLQSHQRLQNLSRQSRPPLSTFQAKFGLRLGQTLHHETFLVYMAFQAWKSGDSYGNATSLVLRKARRADAIWLERVWTSWRLQGQLQKKDHRNIQRLEAIANMEERRQAASEVLHQQLTIAETLLSERQKRTQKEKLQRRSFAAWSRHSQCTFAARSQRAMKLQLEVVNEPHDSGVQNEQEGRELELQRWADLLRRRSQDLRRDATTLEFASGDFKGSRGRAVLRLCWCQWQSWRREHHTHVTDRQEQALLGGHFLPKSKGRQCLGRTWRAWQRLCSGAERPRPVWLQEQHHRLLTKVMGRLTKYQPSHWLLRLVMAAWFIFGRLRPARQRLHHLATAARHSDAQAVMAATAALAPGVIHLPSPVASTPEVHWTPLTHRARSQRLPLRLLSSRDFWTQKSWIRAWRFWVAKERAFNAMLNVTLEDGDTFLVSPKRVAFRH